MYNFSPNGKWLNYVSIFKGFVDWKEIIWNDIRQFFPTINLNKRYPLNCNVAKLHNYTEKDFSGKVLVGSSLFTKILMPLANPGE